MSTTKRPTISCTGAANSLASLCRLRPGELRRWAPWKVRMRARNRACVAGLLVAVVGVACSPADPNPRETPGEKTEWSVLQSVEFDNRGVPIQGPVIKKVQGFEVLGLRGVKGSNVWILLKPQAPPFYKQLPSESYLVPKALVEQLIRERRLSYTVEAVLLSRPE